MGWASCLYSDAYRAGYQTPLVFRDEAPQDCFLLYLAAKDAALCLVNFLLFSLHAHSKNPQGRGSRRCNTWLCEARDTTLHIKRLDRDNRNLLNIQFLVKHFNITNVGM